jgi:hypothetical protein
MDYFGDESERASSGPSPVDWLTGLVRGFHPLRWLLCLAGLVLTGSSLVIAKACFDQEQPDFSGWWQEPIEHAHQLQDDILGGSAMRAVLRGVPLLTLNIMLFCLIGGCLARQELVARRSRRHDYHEKPGKLGTMAFMRSRWKTLLWCFPLTLFIMLFFFIPIVVASFVNAWCGGFGALIVAAMLPVLLMASLVLLIFGFGSLAWPLMPIAVAAECNDQFDALSRSMSYPLKRPIGFILLTSFAVGLACLPLGILTYVSEKTGWQPWARQTLILTGAGFAASLFWSLQTLVYLHLRWAIDGVDAGAVADGPPPKAPSPEKAPVEPAPSGETLPVGVWRRRLHREVLFRGAVIVSWCLTYWLLANFSSGPAEWLGWVLCGQLVPPAEGAYRVASVIAGLWLLAWLAFPTVLWAKIMRHKTEKRRDEKAQEPG